jgi:hypothetical protein
VPEGDVDERPVALRVRGPLERRRLPQHAQVERSRLGRAIGHERDLGQPEACGGRGHRMRAVGGHQHRLWREALEHLDVDLDAVVAADARERRRRRQDREGGERFEAVDRGVDHDVAACDAQRAEERARGCDALREHREAHRRTSVRLQERCGGRARRERQQPLGKSVVGRSHAGPCEKGLDYTPPTRRFLIAPRA